MFQQGHFQGENQEKHKDGERIIAKLREDGLLGKEVCGTTRSG